MKRRCVARNPKTLGPQPVDIRLCKEVEVEHAKSQRQYAHTFHRKNVICVCSAIKTLPDTWALAILLHEMGHLLAGPRGSERAANDAAYRASGIRIRYKDGPYGNQLEWIDSSQKSKVRAFLTTGDRQRRSQSSRSYAGGNA
jgi:hypothetical protein